MDAWAQYQRLTYHRGIAIARLVSHVAFRPSRPAFDDHDMGHPCGTDRSIYKHVDADGQVTYTNTPANDRQIIRLAPAAPRARTPVTPRGDGTAAASRPVSQQQTPSTRDQQRRRILNEEFANESRALDNARQQLQQARQRTGLPAAELRELEAQITEREKNLHALRQELGS